ncbi:hypothetical protein [Streptomyces wuyuanensis]|uniref:hypothetical protein n=1 Tax=Streptomyces wuyuanensis TaxID=1196353 RepID=UPI00342451F7
MTTATLPAITEDTILATLQEVVRESPEKVYESPEHMRTPGATCFYVHTDEAGNRTGPGCIVGTVLHRLGVSLEALSEGEGWPAQSVLNHLASDLDPELLAKLRRVQMSQDNGDTWAEAYSSEFGELS